MSTILDYDINYTAVRPVVAVPNYGGLLALIDTGATMSVWVGSESDLKSLGAVKLRDSYVFGGFGGKATGALYCLNFKFGDLVFVHMPIVVVEEEFSKKFAIILAATLFENLIYTVDNKHHKFKVEIPDGEGLHRRVKFYDSNKQQITILTESDIPDESYKSIAAAFRDDYDKKYGGTTSK